MKKHLDAKTAVLLIVVFSAWGSLYVVNNHVMNRLPPYTVIFLRSLVATITLQALLWLTKVRKPVERGDFKYFLRAGIGGYFLAVNLQSFGTKLTTASLASLINSMNPLSISVMSMLILRERLSWQKIAGILAAIAGVYVILGGVSGGGNIAGLILSLLSLLTWGYISVTNKALTTKYHALQITAYGVSIACALNLLLSGIELAGGAEMQVDLPCILGILYMGTVCTGGAHLLWNRCLSTTEASVCSAFYPVQALVSALTGILFLHEKITGGFVAGSLIIIAGVLFALFQPSFRRRRKS